MKRTSVFCVALLFGFMAFILNGCGGGGGGGDDFANDGPDTDVVGFQFTTDNAREAALIGIEPFAVFYDLSQIIAAIIETIEADENFETGVASLGALLCQEPGGTAALTWSNLTDVGQGSVDLNFNNCKVDDGLFSGTILFSDTLYNDQEAGRETLIAQVEMGLTVQEELDGTIMDMNVDGSFLLRMFRESNGATKLGFRYGGDLDPGAWFEMTEGANKLQLGCFDVSVSFDPGAGEGTFLLGDDSISRVFGVVITDKKLITVTTGPGSPGDLASLVFVGGVPVASGSIGIDYWGFLMGDGCEVLGVPDGVGQQGTANMVLIPVEGGSVRIDLYLEGFGQDDPPLAQTIQWSEFID